MRSRTDAGDLIARSGPEDIDELARRYDQRVKRLDQHDVLSMWRHDKQGSSPRSMNPLPTRTPTAAPVASAHGRR
jgi:hypothetical protein